MEIGRYTRTVVCKEPGLQIVLVTFPPGTRTPKHNHGCRCLVMVRQDSGPIFEVKGGKKTYYPPGSLLPELPFEDPHIVGNDGPEMAHTVNIYQPELRMHRFPDDDIDTILCNASGTSW